MVSTMTAVFDLDGDLDPPRLGDPLEAVANGVRDQFLDQPCHAAHSAELG